MKKRINYIILMSSLGMGSIIVLPIILGILQLVGTVLLLSLIFCITLYSHLFLIEARLWFPYQTDLSLITERVLGKVFGGLTHVIYLAWYYFLLAGFLSTGIFLAEQVFFQGVETPFNRMLCVLPWLGLSLLTFYFFYTTKLAWAWSLFIIEMLLLLTFLYLTIRQGHAAFILQNGILQNGNLSMLKSAIPLLLLFFPMEILFTRLKRDFNNDIEQIKKVIILGSSVSFIIALLWVFILNSFPTLTTGFAYALQHQSRDTAIFTKVVAHAFEYHFTIYVFYVLFILAMLISCATFLYFGMEFFRGSDKALVGQLNLYKKLGKIFLLPMALVLLFPHDNVVYFWYAGLMMLLLFIILPTLIVWSGRYYHELAFGYRVSGGRSLLLSILILGCFLLYFTL